MLLVCSLIGGFGPSRPANANALIASPEEAITLAQVRSGTAVHTILVLDDRDGKISGVDLSQATGRTDDDALAFLPALDDETLQALVGIPKAERTTYAHAELLPAGRGRRDHVAAGTNYTAHADETALRDGVFLFPKVVEPTPAISRVSTAAGVLLDHEVEVCARFDRAVATADDLRAARVGLFVCGDLTDRAVQMRELDPDRISSGIGFTDAKSMPGSFPTGPYLVVPREWRTFVAEIRLEALVNGARRQQASAGQMVQPIDALVLKALATGGEPRWRHRRQPIALLPEGKLEAGAIVLTGTPEGVVFRPPSTRFIIGESLLWAASFAFLDGSPRDYVVERYIEKELSQRRYLQPGDTVVLRATFLGEIVVGIEADRAPPPGGEGA